MRNRKQANCVRRPIVLPSACCRVYSAPLNKKSSPVLPQKNTYHLACILVWWGSGVISQDQKAICRMYSDVKYSVIPSNTQLSLISNINSLKVSEPGVKIHNWTPVTLDLKHLNNKWESWHKQLKKQLYLGVIRYMIKCCRSLGQEVIMLFLYNDPFKSLRTAVMTRINYYIHTLIKISFCYQDTYFSLYSLLY